MRKIKKFGLHLAKWILNILISIDQLVNTIFGGDPDITISSRLGSNYPNSVLAKFVDLLFFWQSRNKTIKSHVINAIEHDESGNDAVVK
jgi:hypothetical protein